MKALRCDNHFSFAIDFDFAAFIITGGDDVMIELDLTYSPYLKSGDSPLTHGDCASSGLLVEPVLLPLHSGRCPVHIVLFVYAVYPNWVRPSRLILIAAFVSLSSVV